MNSVSAFMFLRICLLLISSIIASFVAYWAKDKNKLSHGFPFFRNCKLWNGDFLFVINNAGWNLYMAFIHFLQSKNVIVLLPLES